MHIKVILISGAALALAACSSSNQVTPQQQCMLLQTALCAAHYDPMTDRGEFAVCTQQAAVTCGIVPAPAQMPKFVGEK